MSGVGGGAEMGGRQGRGGFLGASSPLEGGASGRRFVVEGVID
jgi:hypothetical protein